MDQQKEEQEEGVENSEKASEWHGGPLYKRRRYRGKLRSIAFPME